MTYNKTYYLDHRDKYLQAQRKYYAKNKEAIVVRRKQIINCECGTLIYKNSYYNHLKSKKHIRLVETDKNEEDAENTIIDIEECVPSPTYLSE